MIKNILFAVLLLASKPFFVSSAVVLQDVTDKYILAEVEDESEEICEAFREQSSEYNDFVQVTSRSTPTSQLSQKTFESRLSSNTSNLLCLENKFCSDGLQSIRSPSKGDNVIRSIAASNEEDRKPTETPVGETKVLNGDLAVHEAFAVRAIMHGDMSLLEDVIKSSKRKFPNQPLVSRWIENDDDDDEEYGSQLFTLLHYCVIHDNIDAFVWLLNDANADPNITNQFGTTLLQFIFDFSCCQEERFYFLQIAIEFGANVSKRTVLQCVRYNLQNVLFTIHHNVRKIPEIAGGEALKLAQQHDNLGMIKCLRRLGCQ